MGLQIVLLRGINVGGNGIVPMATLREMLEEMGYSNPRTLLQSGNVVLGAEAKKTPASIEKAIETALHKRFELPITVVVRTPAEWTSIIERNPFGDEAKSDPSHFVVMPFKAAPSAAAVSTLRAAHKGPERFVIDGREAYIYYPAGQGTSKFTNALIEKKLGVAGTARNWNTVQKLAALVAK